MNFNGMECLIHKATFKSFVRYLEHSNNMIQQIVVNLFTTGAMDRS